MMKTAAYVVGFLLLLVGVVLLVQLRRANSEIATHIAILEAELGHLKIDDPDKVHLVAIKQPKVPPEIAKHVAKVWQFRMYEPKGYDVIRFTGGGDVTEDGLYFSGGFSTQSGSPTKESAQSLVTVSLQSRGDDVACFCSRSRSGSTSLGTSIWYGVAQSKLHSGDLRLKTILRPGDPVATFEPTTILPIIKGWDTSTAKTKSINSQDLATYRGGTLIFSPKTVNAEFKQLRSGIVPNDTSTYSVAEGVEQ